MPQQKHPVSAQAQVLHIEAPGGEGQREGSHAMISLTIGAGLVAACIALLVGALSHPPAQSTPAVPADTCGNTVIGNTVGNTVAGGTIEGNTFGNTVAFNTVGNTVGNTGGNPPLTDLRRGC